MLLNLDDQQLRSSLALWKEVVALGGPALQGRSTRERVQVLARLDDTVAGCLAVLRACTAGGDEVVPLNGLIEELQGLREWVQEGRTAVGMMLNEQR